MKFPSRRVRKNPSGPFQMRGWGGLSLAYLTTPEPKEILILSFPHSLKRGLSQWGHKVQCPVCSKSRDETGSMVEANAEQSPHWTAYPFEGRHRGPAAGDASAAAETKLGSSSQRLPALLLSSRPESKSQPQQNKEEVRWKSRRPPTHLPDTYTQPHWVLIQWPSGLCKPGPAEV